MHWWLLDFLLFIIISLALWLRLFFLDLLLWFLFGMSLIELLQVLLIFDLKLVCSFLIRCSVAFVQTPPKRSHVFCQLSNTWVWMKLFYKFLLLLWKNEESCHWLFWSVGMGLGLLFAFFLRFLFLLRFGFVLLSEYCAFKFLSQLLRMVLFWLWFALFLLLRLLLDISDRFWLLIFYFLFHWFDLVYFFLINSSIS